eukprot:181234_1
MTMKTPPKKVRRRLRRLIEIKKTSSSPTGMVTGDKKLAGATTSYTILPLPNQTNVKGCEIHCEPSYPPTIKRERGSKALELAWKISEHRECRGEDTRYWEWKVRKCRRDDLWNTCRECKQPFTKLGENLSIRRGGRIELRYHEGCFSGIADPRSQAGSTANKGKYAAALSKTAAPRLPYSKMRTSSHW